MKHAVISTFERSLHKIEITRKEKVLQKFTFLILRSKSHVASSHSSEAGMLTMVEMSYLPVRAKTDGNLVDWSQGFIAQDFC